MRTVGGSIEIRKRWTSESFSWNPKPNLHPESGHMAFEPFASAPP